MTSLGKHYKRGFQFLFTIGNTDFELNTSVILSASGFFLKVFLQLPSCTPDCYYHVVTILNVAEQYRNKGRSNIENFMCLVSVFPLS